MKRNPPFRTPGQPLQPPGPVPIEPTINKIKRPPPLRPRGRS